MSAVAVVGNISLDVVAGGEPRPGGGVYYGARALAGVGADAAVAARCGLADAGLLLPPLEAFGLPVAFRSGERTSAFTFHYEGDHRVMRVDDVGDSWTEQDVTGWVRTALSGAAWVQVAALLRSDFSVATLHALAREGARLLIDGQGLVRVPRPGPVVHDAMVDPETLQALTVLKLNEDEARVLAGGVDPSSLRALGIPEVVLTLGSAGALVVTDRLAERIPPEPAGDVSDPTGAGDSFCAIYVWSRARGADPVEAGREANATAAQLISEASA